MTSCELSQTGDEREREVREVIQEVIEENSSCTADEDCELAPTSNSCFGSCLSAISTEGVAVLRDAIDDLDKGICAGPQEDGCPYFSPDCPDGVPVCIDNQCTHLELK